MIQAIDKASVQKICCGQVVVDLATAVKEVEISCRLQFSVINIVHSFSKTHLIREPPL